MVYERAYDVNEMGLLYNPKCNRSAKFWLVKNFATKIREKNEIAKMVLKKHLAWAQP